MIDKSGGTTDSYIISNPDQAAGLVEQSDIGQDKITKAAEIVTKGMGKVIIDPLTLERLVSEFQRIQSRQ